MLEQLKQEVYEANLLLPGIRSGDIYLGKCERCLAGAEADRDQAQRSGV